jgi:hypothetical protein
MKTTGFNLCHFSGIIYPKSLVLLLLLLLLLQC